MKKGRSEYHFTLPNKINKALVLINTWMEKNGYAEKIKKEEKYYRTGSAMSAWYAFQYEVQGDSLTLYAWLDSTSDYRIDVPDMNMFVTNYNQMIVPLLHELHYLEENSYQDSEKDIQDGQKVLAGEIVNMEQHQQMQDVSRNSKNKFAIAGFILGLVAMIANAIAFVGSPILIGGMVVFLAIGFSAVGLKSNKRGLSMAGLICGIIAAVLLCIQLVLILTK